jgi:hypothetical protein
VTTTFSISAGPTPESRTTMYVWRPFAIIDIVTYGSADARCCSRMISVW